MSTWSESTCVASTGTEFRIDRFLGSSDEYIPNAAMTLDLVTANCPVSEVGAIIFLKLCVLLLLAVACAAAVAHKSCLV
jgi:hypothetical protein